MELVLKAANQKLSDGARKKLHHAAEDYRRRDFHLGQIPGGGRGIKRRKSFEHG